MKKLKNIPAIAILILLVIAGLATAQQRFQSKSQKSAVPSAALFRDQEIDLALDKRFHKQISLTLQNIDLNNALMSLTEKIKVSMVADHRVSKRNLTIHIEQRPAWEAMLAISDALGCQWMKTGEIFFLKEKPAKTNSQASDTLLEAISRNLPEDLQETCRMSTTERQQQEATALNDFASSFTDNQWQALQQPDGLAMSSLSDTHQKSLMKFLERDRINNLIGNLESAFRNFQNQDYRSKLSGARLSLENKGGFNSIVVEADNLHIDFSLPQH